jgi:hypothetical protein
MDCAIYRTRCTDGGVACFVGRILQGSTKEMSLPLLMQHATDDERGLFVSPFYEYSHLRAIFMFDLRIQCPLSPEVNASDNA